MHYVNLGKTGLRVSRICLGMMSYGRHESREWALGEEEAEPIVRRAVESGITFFDTADVYNGGGSEVITGRLLRGMFGMREEYVVATKVHGATMPGENGRGLSRKHIMASIDASLERLGLDYVDLYLIYREEEREMIPLCLDQGVGVLPWSPLARGMLAGNRSREGERRTTRARTDAFADSLYKPETDFSVIDRLAEMASERGVAPAQVALAWLLHKPGVTAPIAGATKLEHLKDALAAEQLRLSEEELERLEELYIPHAIAGHQ